MTFLSLLSDAWALLRRHADLLVRIAGPTIFLPAFALLLLADPLPALPQGGLNRENLDLWLNAVEAWGDGNAIWYLAASVVGLFGQAAIAHLLLDPAHPDVAGAMRRAGVRLPRFVLATLLCNLAVGLGIVALIVPGLILYARLVATIPVLASEQPISAVGGMARSVALTRGRTFAVLGALVALWMAQVVIGAPFGQVARSATGPVGQVIAGAGIAAIAAAYTLATLLVGIALYRRGASIGT